MRLAKWLFIILILFSVGHASAMDVINVEGFSYGVFAAADNSVYTMIQINNVDPEYVSHFIIDSNTYTFEANITYLSGVSSQVNTSFYSKITENTSTYSEIWYHVLPFDDLYFVLGSGNYDLEGSVSGGVRVSRSISDEVVFAPENFSIVSDHPVDLRLYEVLIEDTGPIIISDEILDLVRKIPFVGEYVYQILSIVRSIVSAFVILAYISIKNWTFFLVLFESFVFFHATSIMQNTSGKPSKLITESFIAIASDNKLLLDFLVNVFTQIINMFVGAVRMFRG